MSDPINPKHYRVFFDTDAIEIMEAYLTEEEMIGYLKGSSLKYRLRAGGKGDVEEDIRKAQWFQSKLDEYCGEACMEVQPKQDFYINQRTEPVEGILKE